MVTLVPVIGGGCGEALYVGEGLSPTRIELQKHINGFIRSLPGGV